MTNKALRILQLNKQNRWIITGSVICNKVKEMKELTELSAKFLKHRFSDVSLTVVSNIEPPFVINDGNYSSDCSGYLCEKNVTRDGRKTLQRYCCIGYNVDMIKYFSNELKINMIVYLVEDSFYGSKINGTWNGMVRDIAIGKADLAIAPMAILEHRAEVIDFTDVPYIVGGMTIAVRTKRSQKFLLSFKPLLSLSTILWILILAITLCGFILTLNTERINIQATMTVGYLMYYVGLTFQRDIGGVTPRSHSSRTIAVSVAVFMLIVMSTYTAELTAENVVYQEKLPITGFNDEKVCLPK